MSTLFESRFLSRTFAIDEISKRPQTRQLKFKRAFQFLQLLLIQRVYTLNAIACSNTRRLSKQSNDQENEKQDDYEVFLGGSCNPTTWRHDHAIPYFSSRSVSYYNPQVANWTPELVEIEHRAKEHAPLLFFVIDNDTRALASMVEVCYLAARGRNIIVVMSPMPEMNSTKFIQQKSEHILESDLKDHENTRETRHVCQQLLRSLNIPVFETIDSALECAAYILETTKRNLNRHSSDSGHDSESSDVVPPLPNSPINFHSRSSSSSVVFIRSLSNKTSFDDPNDFYRQIRQNDLSQNCSIAENFNSKTNLNSLANNFRSEQICSEENFSCSTERNDDEGYDDSWKSPNREFSSSNSSLHLDSFESVAESTQEKNNSKKISFQKFNELMSRFSFYFPIVRSTNSSLTQSIFVLFSGPFRFLRNNHLFPNLSRTSSPVEEQSDEVLSESVQTSPPSSPFSCSPCLYHVYVAGGKRDQLWLEKSVFPIFQKKQIRYVKRQAFCDFDQTDINDDKHLRAKSQVLFYLINGDERLSDLTAELAFLIGERKHKIIVHLESKMNPTNKLNLAPCERRDLDRSRSYLEDLMKKEQINYETSLEKSLQLVLQSLDETN